MLVFLTGAGGERAAVATHTALAEFPVTALINTGCAGALVEDLPAGALVLPEAIVEVGSDLVRHGANPALVRQLQVAADRSRQHARSGAIVTSDKPIKTSAEKRIWHEQFGAIAVEMEGCIVARIAAARGLPFASARAILDTLDMDLSLLNSWVNADGAVNKVKGIVRTLGHPTDLTKVIPLASSAKLAEIALERMFRAFFEG